MLDAPKADGTVGKALQVLDQVAEFGRPVRFSELLHASPFPKPTLYRFVQTLTNQGMLAFDSDRQTYAPGVRLVRLAHSAWRNSSLAAVARPFIDALAGEVPETVHLAQLDNGHVLFVDKRQATTQFETWAQAGKVAPGYCTGVGKAILAHLSEDQLARAMRHQAFEPNTQATITDVASLTTELECIRRDGVAFDRQEHEQGIISIAAPILTKTKRPIGAVSIATATTRRDLEGLDDFRSALLHATQAIGAEAEAWHFPTWT